MVKANFLVLIAVAAFGGCSNNSNHQIEQNALGSFVARSGIEGACRFPLPDLQFKETEKHTVGKLNDPAYIVRIAFTCENPLSGHTPWDVYVGYVSLKDGSSHCIGWHRDKNALKNSMSWMACGGLNS